MVHPAVSIPPLLPGLKQHISPTHPAGTTSHQNNAILPLHRASPRRRRRPNTAQGRFFFFLQPIQSDYSDVYNVMAFFRGDPETETETETGTGAGGGHEELAEKIGRQASEYAREYWRWEDMQAYVSFLFPFECVCGFGFVDGA